MEFTASSGGDGGSYEKPKPGSYFGVLIGAVDIGTQEGGKFAPRRKILLRWELHRRKGPSTDSEGHIHTVTAQYTQSFADKSSLRPVVEAHMGKIRDGQRTSPRDWFGKAARLTLEESSNKNYVNVTLVAPLDPEEDEIPKQQEESSYWLMSDAGLNSPPVWAKYWVEKSVEWRAMHPETTSQEKPARDGYGRNPVGATVDGDEEDIPF